MISKEDLKIVKKEIVVAVLRDLIEHRNYTNFLPDLFEIQSDTEAGKTLIEDYAKQIVKILSPANEILKQYLKITKTCRLNDDLTETDVIYYFNGKFTNSEEYLLLKEWLDNDSLY